MVTLYKLHAFVKENRKLYLKTVTVLPLNKCLLQFKLPILYPKTTGRSFDKNLLYRPPSVYVLLSVNICWGVTNLACGCTRLNGW